MMKNQVGTKKIFSDWGSARHFLASHFDGIASDLGHEVYRQAWIFSFALQKTGDPPPTEVLIDDVLDTITFETSENGVWKGELKVRKDGAELAYRNENDEIVSREFPAFPPPKNRNDQIHE